MNQGSRLYRNMTAVGTTHLDLLLATYDALCEDLRLAGKASERADIEARCRHSHHAALLIGHLESWISLLDEKPLQDVLIQFYAFVRTESLRLQGSPSPEGFGTLAMHVSEVRAAWQKKTAASLPPVPAPRTGTSEESHRLSYLA